MTIIIKPSDSEDVEFPFDTGIRVLKMKHKDRLPEGFEMVEDFWHEIKPLSFKEIMQIENMEQRRVALLYSDIESLASEMDAELISRETIRKKTKTKYDTTEEFDDTYELYRVSLDKLIPSTTVNLRQRYVHFVKFKDTSTDRMYLAWTTDQKDAIEAIAWTITVPFNEGDIDHIVRQGDCILVYPKDGAKRIEKYRHLTKEEYLNLLKYES